MAAYPFFALGQRGRDPDKWWQALTTIRKLINDCIFSHPPAADVCRVGLLYAEMEQQPGHPKVGYLVMRNLFLGIDGLRYDMKGWDRTKAAGMTTGRDKDFDNANKTTYQFVHIQTVGDRLLGKTPLGIPCAVKLSMIDILTEGKPHQIRTHETNLIKSVKTVIFPKPSPTCQPEPRLEQLTINDNDGSKSQASSGSGSKKSRRRNKKQNRKGPIETAVHIG
ncbi:unnamed protein product, partial [Mesorhabditis spiculigera]